MNKKSCTEIWDVQRLYPLSDTEANNIVVSAIAIVTQRVA